MPDYDSVVGAAARFQRAFNGKQPGDPAKAASVVLGVAAMEADEKWRELSVSTDFAQGDRGVA